MQVLNALQLKKGAKAEYNKMGSLMQPVQFLPEKEKNEEWAAWNIDWIENQGVKQLRRNSRRLLKNYKLAKVSLIRLTTLLKMIIIMQIL